ncbi:uncharacterized protein Aud_009271 [Aspergillus udagawae]|uniref:Metallo-beta-lactamase domain-containing protein n=1 Tax=Aspergillus udagawae TaxID=91492 RepID=A0A8E0R1S2_9EURO|nr:uncharacterized protein Aud_009271 [Aspergillus udagawae]GIC92798.1 hypothetical protein Aud_009271 [Aspergillus udagawae]
MFIGMETFQYTLRSNGAVLPQVDFKNLTTIYITHAHGDHFYGNAALIERFPEAKILATAEVVAKTAEAILPDGMDAFWRRLFPGEIPEKLVTAVALNEDHFMLEGEKLVVVRIGHTDTDEKHGPLGACYRVGSPREIRSMTTHIHI